MTKNAKKTSPEISSIIKYKKELENNSNFIKVELEKNEILFNEWDSDNNLYLIIEWSVSIRKYTNKEKTRLKQLAVLSAGDFLWEWALKRKEKKQVKVTSLEKTTLYKIDTIEAVENFIKEDPKIALELFIQIIDTSNKRLLEANSMIISNYEMNKKISEIDKFDYKNIFSLIDSFKDIIWVDYIIYLEKNPVLKSYLTIKYDTREKWKMQQEIIELANKKVEIKDIKNTWIKVVKNNYIQWLKNWNTVIWYLFLWRKNKSFSITEEKIIESISSSFASIISLKEIYSNEANRKYMRWE